MPKTVDYSKWAVVAHNDDTGFGRQAADIKAVLGVQKHIVIPSERLADKPLVPPHDVLLKPSDPTECVERALEDLDGIIFFERTNWHPELLPVARKLGVATVCVPNWEWFNGVGKSWALCDLLACPTKFTVSVVEQYGWDQAKFLPWAIDTSGLPVRKIKGPARTFFHNAGLVDRDDRKGTRDTILAFKRVKRSDIRLIVRMQKEVPLPPLDERIEIRVGNLAHPADLYREGDVAIQPSKMEGIGFMVLEPVCCGIPVLTIDYPPMNEFVQQPEMRACKRWFKRRAFATSWIPHAHLRLPSINDLSRKIEWCASNDMTRVSEENLAWSRSTFSKERLFEVWTQQLNTLVKSKASKAPCPA